MIEPATDKDRIERLRDREYFLPKRQTGEEATKVSARVRGKMRQFRF